MSNAITATFRERLQGAWNRFEYVPKWAWQGMFVEHFRQVLNDEARDRTDPESAALFSRIRNSANVEEAVGAVQDFLAAKT